MLLTDGNPNSNEDLRAFESAILNVAKTESIDLDVKRGLAAEEVSQEVLDFLLNGSTGVDPRAETRRTDGVIDVVVTRQLKRWHALHTLEVFYRDAFHNQLNDRYREKFFEYRHLSRRAREQTFQFGVGLVLAPLAAPGLPEVAFIAGLRTDPIYFVRTTWANAAGQESTPSEATAISPPPGSALTVKALSPPTGAVGFHVYVGLTQESIARQTAAPVPPGQTYVLPDAGVMAGPPPGDGQAPDLFLTGGSLLRRG
jgi:hypothetical protein